MAIKASETTPVKVVLTQADPSGETYLMFRRPTWRDDELRGELLKDTHMVMTDNGIAKRVQVNPYLLRSEEIWILYMDGNLVVEDTQGNRDSLLKPRKDMSKEQFMNVLRDPRLDTDVLWEIHNKMIAEVASDWRFPF